jgi:predicted phosphatase
MIKIEQNFNKQANEIYGTLGMASFIQMWKDCLCNLVILSW